MLSGWRYVKFCALLLVWPPAAHQMIGGVPEREFRHMVRRNRLLSQLRFEIGKLRNGGYWKRQEDDVRRTWPYGSKGPELIHLRDKCRWVNR